MPKAIYKKVVLDEQNRPVEVIIDYDEWREIERLLKTGREGMNKDRLRKYAGIMHVEEEPLAYQRRMRSEWSE